MHELRGRAAPGDAQDGGADEAFVELVTGGAVDLGRLSSLGDERIVDGAALHALDGAGARREIRGGVLASARPTGRARGRLAAASARTWGERSRLWDGTRVSASVPGAARSRSWIGNSSQPAPETNGPCPSPRYVLTGGLDERHPAPL